MFRRLIFLLLLLLPVQAGAQQATFASTFLEGSWAVRVEGTNIMRFDLKLTADGWEGVWVKPTSFRTNGPRFGDIVMPATERTSDSGRRIGDWAEITFDDPRPGEESDVFRFHLLSADRAEMIYVGTGLAPYVLERVPAGAELGPFVQGRVYGGPPDTVPAVPVVAPLPVPRPPTPVPTSTSPVQGPVDNRPPAVIGR